MSRQFTAAVLLFGITACAEPDAVTSPPTAIRHFSASVGSCSPESGQQMIDAGQYKKAINEFTCVIGLDPTAVEGYRGRIEAEIMLGKFSDAARDHARITAFVLPVHADAQQTIIAGYKARLDVAPNAIPALSGLSMAYWWFFDYPAALHVLDDLLAVDPNNLYGTLFRGSNRLLHGSSKVGGVADLDRAIALEPDDAHAYVMRADARYEDGFLEEALADYDRGLEHLPNSREGHYGRGWTLVDLGRPDEARRDFDSILNRAPGELPSHLDPRALVGRAWCKHETGDSKGSLEDLAQAIVTDPYDAEAYVFRGRVHLEVGDHESARSKSRRALSWSPTSRWTRPRKT